MNLVAAVMTSFDYNTFGRFAWGWIAFAVGVAIWQIVTRRSSWSLVFIILAAAGVGFWINAALLTEIVNSC